jgi:mono/diheme cytochrome c family protein
MTLNVLRRMCLLAVLIAPSAHAADTPAPTDGGTTVPKAVLDAGKAQFEATCSACHGANGRGGRGGAPDLLTSPVAMDDAARFREWVRAGSPARGMPPFPLDDPTLDSIQAHLKTLAASARRRGNREVPVVGNAERGHTYFEGAGGCNGCHSVSGDLKGIGARYTTRVLQGRIVLPRGSGVHPGLKALGVRIPGVTDEVPVNDSPRTVNVTSGNSEHLTGVLIAISDFEVVLRDADGRYRSFARHGDSPRVEIQDPAQPHIDRLGRMSDRDLHDVTAYLASLK